MKESDIRPADLFNRYLELADRDAAALLKHRDRFVIIQCPACGDAGSQMLVKNGYTYDQCRTCGSLYLNPRPDASLMTEFYRTADSVRFWATDFYRSTTEARREKMFRPRAALAAQIADQAGLGRDARIADVGAGYGMFLEEIRALDRFGSIIGIEPAADLAKECRAKGFDVIEAVAEELTEGRVAADLAVSFEVLEHVLSPYDFLKGIAGIMAPNGRMLLTTLTCDGFDIQVLWDAAKAVSPPHHINFLSIKGYRLLLARAGLEIETIATPGQLDVDIVANSLHENSDLVVDRFVRMMALNSTEATRLAFQTFLQDNLLSSHVRIIARHPHD